MKYFFTILFLIPLACFSQGPGTSTDVDVTGFFEYMRVFKPYNYLTGLHPLVIEGKGAGEANTFNLTPLSLGDFGANYGWTGRYQDDAKGGVRTVYVITIHASATTGLIKTAITWAKANLPGVDTTQMIFNGWSLAGSAGLNIVGSDTVGAGSTGRRLSAVVLAAPVAAGDGGASPGQIYPGLNKTHLPVFLLDATNDGNGSTNTVTTGILSTKQAGGLSASPEIKYYFPNTNNTTYQSNGGHQAAQKMMNDTAVGSKNVFLDSSHFTGHSNTNATVSVRNLMEQALAYQKTAGGNVPPTANAGTDQTIILPTNSGVLNGSASSDPDGTIATYLWSKTSGPSTFTIANSAIASTTVSGLVAGTYVFTLLVTDNLGVTGSDTKTIVVNAANTNPTAVITADQSITLPTSSVTIADIGSFDSDGSLVGWLFSKVSGPAGSSFFSSGSSSTPVNGLVAGTYVFRLTVTDNLGGTGSATTTVTVNAAPTVPSCTTNNTTTSITNTTALLSWNTSATATGYNVYVYLNGGSVPGSPTYTTASLSQSATGLTPGLTYKYFVIPTNAVGPATGCSTSATVFITTSVTVAPWKTWIIKRRQ